MQSAATEIYTLSLHDALPIYVLITAVGGARLFHNAGGGKFKDETATAGVGGNEKDWSTAATFFDMDKDRKSTRLNSSHGYISYAVFCLKKKKNRLHRTRVLGR